MTILREDLPGSDGLQEPGRMKVLVDTISSYIEHYHGGRVEFVEFVGGVVKVHLSGACEGCDLASVTLHGWVEGTIRQFFPDIQDVVAV